MLAQRHLLIPCAAPVRETRPPRRGLYRLLAAFEALADHAAISVVVVALPVLLGALAFHAA